MGTSLPAESFASTDCPSGAATLGRRPASLPWCSTFLGPGELYALAVFSGHRLEGFLPTVTRASEDGPSLSLAGEGISDYVDCVVAADTHDEVVSCLERAIADETTCIGALQTVDVPAWSVLVEAFSRLREWVRPSARCPVVSLPASFDEYFDDLPAWMRRNLRKGKRRLEQLGRVEWETAHSGNVDELMEALFELHARRWSTKQEPGVFADPRVRAFHRDSSPRLLIEHAVRDAIASGATCYDFLRGEEAYKYEWRARATFTYSMRLTAARPMAERVPADSALTPA